MNYSHKKLKTGLVSLLFLSLSVPTIQAQKGNPRVDNFLKAMSTFPNIDGARAAFQAARFTDAERLLLRDALKNPIYTPQITRLGATITKTTFPSKPARTTIAIRLASEAHRIDTLNAKLLAQLGGLKPSEALSSGTDAPPRILSLSSDTIEPMQYLTISGTGFLPAGRIQWTLGSKTIPAAAERWEDNLILVKLTNVRGIPDSPRSKVSICDQYFKPLTSAPIHFIPTWDFQEISSSSLTPISNPYNSVVAFLMFCTNNLARWCSTYSIVFPDVPSYALLNGWTIADLYYASEPSLFGYTDTGEGEDEDAYIGMTTLPRQTRGELCQGVMYVPPIWCYVTIKGPLGIPYK
jgi:hypothetical protein